MMVKINNFKAKPILVENLFYRLENNNFLTIRGNKDMCYLGPFSLSIFNLIKSHKTIEDIINQLYIDLEITDALKFVEEIIKTISLFETNGIIKIDGGWLKMENGCCLVGESEYKFLSEYCNDIIINKNFENFVLPSRLVNFYSISNLRELSFKSYQNEFIKVENNKIVSCIFIGELNKANSTCTLSGFIYENMCDLIDLFSYVKNELRQLGILKVKFSATRVNQNIKSVLVELGFSYETVLIKEINGLDVLVYSYFIMEE